MKKTRLLLLAALLLAIMALLSGCNSDQGA